MFVTPNTIEYVAHDSTQYVFVTTSHIVCVTLDIQHAFVSPVIKQHVFVTTDRVYVCDTTVRIEYDMTQHCYN